MMRSEGDGVKSLILTIGAKGRELPVEKLNPKPEEPFRGQARAMKHVLSFLCAAVLALAAGGCGAHAPGNYAIRFGIFESDKAGNDNLTQETTVIPLKPRETGFLYGFEIEPSNQDPYTFQYVLHLPAPSTVSGDLAQPSAGMGAKGALTTVAASSTEEISGGSIQETMWFDSGDPLGNYSADILINGKLVKTIEFTVTKP